MGRRPAPIIAFIIYITGCAGAATKASYPLLFVMRCLQGVGISGTMAVSWATVSDIVTSAERGSYTSYVQMGWMVGPALGPVFFSHQIVFLPETCRATVGNGSISAQTWNRPLHKYLRARTPPNESGLNSSSAGDLWKGSSKLKLNPLESIKLFLEKQTGILLIYGGLIYADSYMVYSTMPKQSQEKYGFNTLQISFCYLATASGAITSVLLIGRILDWNFRRYAKRVDMEISNNKQQDLSDFPIEIARLQVGMPLLVLAGVSVLGFR